MPHAPHGAPSPHEQNISHRFSRAATSYDRASPVQEEIAHALLKLVPSHVTPARVLDAGCGTGRLLALARTRWPGADCVGLDLSPGMLRIAGARFADDPRVALVEGDVARYQVAMSFDLILSSSSTLQ